MELLRKAYLHWKNHNLFYLLKRNGETQLLNNRILRFRRTGRFAQLFPKVIQLQTQSYCNARCIFCPYPETRRKLPQGTMNEELFRKIADEAAVRPELRTMVFCLQNEPLMDDRLLDFIQYFRKTGTKAHTTVVTNGELLTTELVDRLEELGVERLTVSVNTMDEEVFRKIMPGVDFQRVIDTLHTITAKRRKNPTIVVGFVRHSHNFEETGGFIRYWQSRGLLTMMLPVINRAGSLANFEKFEPPPINVKRRTIGMRLSTPPVCLLPFQRIAILFNGDVPICGEDWNRSLIVGNVKNSSIQDVFQGRVLRDIRDKMTAGRYEELDPCRCCSMGGFSMTRRTNQQNVKCGSG